MFGLHINEIDSIIDSQLNTKYKAYYTRLGLTPEQSKVLSSFEYDNVLLAKAINVYYTTKDCHDKLSFCESIVKFADDRELNNDILRQYINKFESKQEPEKVDFPINFASTPAPVKSTVNINTMQLDDSIDALFCEGTANSYDCDDDCNDDCDDEVEDYNNFNMQPQMMGCNTFSMGFANGFGSSISSFNQGSNIQKVIENIRTDRYEHIEEKGFRNVLNNPTSTFRTTCNNAALDIIKLQISRKFNINKSAVRIEELLNYFKYNLTKPTTDKFSIKAEICNKPDSKNKIMFVGIQGKDEIPQRQNVVILLDVSGSMSGNEKQTQAAIITLVSKLNTGDKLSLITYSSDDKIVIDDITIKEDSIDFVIQRLLQVEIYGGTWGSKGLDKAYELIEKNKIEDGINRVVIITDGDFNFEDCDTDSIEKLILKKKETGAYLSVIGTGELNTNDELMNTLAKNGNGNYCYIDSIEDLEENIMFGYNKIMFSIAKDVKAQIEFNPKYVSRYRLIGYENREINHEDLKNDKVIAEPFGCGAHAVAVYELEMAETNEVKSDLKYQKPVVIDSDNLCTISIRYKELDETESKEISKDIVYNVEDMSYNTKLAYIIYILGEKLRKSEYATEKDVKTALKILNELYKSEEINRDKAKILFELFD